jgi:hypothetical protein
VCNEQVVSLKTQTVELSPELDRLLPAREVFRCYGRIYCCGKCEADRLQVGLLPSLAGHKIEAVQARGSLVASCRVERAEG